MYACHPALERKELLNYLITVRVNLSIESKDKMHGITAAILLDYSHLTQLLVLLFTVPSLIFLATYFWLVPNSFKVNAPLSLSSQTPHDCHPGWREGGYLAHTTARMF